MDTAPISSRSMVSTKHRVFRLSPSCYAVSSLVATLCLSSSVLAASAVPGEWVGERASESLKKIPFAQQDTYTAQLQQRQFEIAEGQYPAQFFTGAHAILSVDQYARNLAECATYAPSTCTDTVDGQLAGATVHLNSQATSNRLTFSGENTTAGDPSQETFSMIKIAAAESSALSGLRIDKQYHYTMDSSLNESAWRRLRFTQSSAVSGQQVRGDSFHIQTESSVNDNQLLIKGGRFSPVITVTAANSIATNTLEETAVVNGELSPAQALRPTTFSSNITVYDALSQSDLTTRGEALRNTLAISGGTFGEIEELASARAELFTSLTSNTKAVGMIGGDQLEHKNIALDVAIKRGLNMAVSSQADVSDNQIHMTGGKFDAIGTVAGGSALSEVRVQTYLSDEINIFGKKQRWKEPFAADDSVESHQESLSVAKEGYNYKVSVRESYDLRDAEDPTFYPIRTSFELNANDNSVNIDGVQVKEGIEDTYGAYLSANVQGLKKATQASYVFNARYNQVNLSTDTVFNQSVAGVAMYWRDDYPTAKVAARATDNNIIISRAPSFGEDSVVAGAVVLTEDDVDITRTFKALPHNDVDLFSNNTLNFVNYTGTSTIAHVGNFEYYQFNLPESFKVNDSVALRAKTIYLDNPNNPTQHAAIGAVEYEGNIAQLKQNDQLFLMKADDLQGSLANEGEAINLRQGVTLEVPTVITAQDNTVKLVVRDRLRATESAKVLSEGFLSSALLNIRAGDVVAHSGVAAANRAVVDTQEQASVEDGMRAFSVLEGSSGRHMSGSHIDMNGAALLAGVAWGKTASKGHLTLGGFFESGQAHYDTRNVSSGGAKFHGSGHAHYAGAGVLARFNWNNGLYAEGSLRTGRMHNRFNSGLRDVSGVAANYALSTPYYGAHVGMGYAWQVTDKMSMDVYGNYLFARQNGKNVRLETGDEVSFDAVNSHRMQLGTRANWRYGRVNLYAGVGYEHDLSTKAVASAYGVPIDSPTVRGGSGMGEIGIRVVPTAKAGWGIDAGLRGYTGKRREVDGALRVSYTF